MGKVLAFLSGLLVVHREATFALFDEAFRTQKQEGQRTRNSRSHVFFAGSYLPSIQRQLSLV